ncbi:MAG TPA: aminotransferase class V-fold PLP-dependent enzyme [Xanthomonadales bacterium]|nr:aminotransferase class V-fold PLP-dependent enzyme [Xanthomonadales bacterium]
MPDRRELLSLLGLAGLGAAIPLRAGAIEACDAPPAMPERTLLDSDEDAYWSAIRRQFLIPDDEVYLNNGTVGSSPMPVLKAVIDGFNDLERMDDVDPEDYPIWGYGPFLEFREPLAKFVNAPVHELALLRNATEANSHVANGLDLRSGDEVLMSDQEHPSGEQPWLLRARRYGIVVKKFEIPKPPKNAAEILERIDAAIGPRTRVLFVSHISTVTGVVMPAKAICKLARERGVLSVLDGAHVPGMMKLDIADIGCDVYTASPHKWLQAPKGSGFLFVREAVMPRIWNTIVTAGWDDPTLKAERFQRIGSSNVAMLWGLRAAIAFAESIGMDRIERRHRQLADWLHARMVERGAESWTSPDPALRCAIATVNVPPIARMELETWLWKEHRIRIRGGEPSKLRLSTPYYLRRSDLERFVAAFDAFRARTAQPGRA